MSNQTQHNDSQSPSSEPTVPSQNAREGQPPVPNGATKELEDTASLREEPASQAKQAVPAATAGKPSSPVPGPAFANPAQAAPANTDLSQEDEDLEAQLAYETLKRRREVRKRKRIIVIAIIGVVLLVGVLVFVIGQANSTSTEGATQMLATGMAYEGEFATTVTANGATEPVSSTVVSPEVSGIVEDLRVQEGDKVQEGDVLFTLKNETLDKDVRDAETELQAAQRAVESADRAISDAYDSYNRAVEEYNRAVQATNTIVTENEDGTTTETEVGSTASFDDSGLRSAISSAEDAYQTALETRDAAQSKLDEAKKTAEKRTVKAPVTGTIVSLNAKNGTTYGSSDFASGATNTNGTLMQISDLNQMKVTVQVNEVDISKITKGQVAKATFSAVPGLELDATVEHIASVSSGAGSGDATGGGGGVVTYAVDLIIPKPDDKLKPGMTATVSITTQSVPNTIVVPAAAIQEGMADDGTPNKYVTVVDNAETKQTHDVTVEVIAENSSEAAVKGDVHDGDAIVLGGAGAAAGLEALTGAGANAEVAG